MGHRPRGPRKFCTHMRHFDDSALSELMAGQLDESEIRRFGSHVRECARCARRFEGWRGLFPQVERLLDAAPPAPVVMLPGGPTLILPDRESGQRLLSRLRRVKILALLLVLGMAGVLLVDHRAALLDRLFGWQPGGDALDPPPATNRATVPAYLTAEQQRPAPAPADSLPADSTPRSGSRALTLAQGTESYLLSSPPADSGLPASKQPAAAAKPEPASASPSSAGPLIPPTRLEHSVSAAQPDPSESAAPRVTPGAPWSPDPSPAPVVTGAVFQPVSMELAIVALGGTIREIAGLERLSIEAGPGALVDGANPAADVVRLRYRSDSGTVTLIEQRRGPGQADAEPRVTVSPSTGGRSVARWVDPAGLWLMLQARGDRSRFLSLANAIR